MNLIAYTIYFVITYLITVHAGLTFYRNGRIYILNLFNQDHQLTDYINRLLLTGYYLLNLGYAAIKINGWETIETVEDLVSGLSSAIGKITILLAILHYVNMTVIALWHQNNNHLSNLKNKLS